MMHGPPLVAWLLVALSTAAALSCVLRGQARQEALTGAGMAVMAVPLSVVDPWRWTAPVFAAVFACAVLWTLARPQAHAGHRAHHAICSAAMVYMAVAMSGAAPAHGEHAGHGGSGTPLLTGLLLLYFAGYVVRMGARLVALPSGAEMGAGAARIRLRHAPEVAAACRVSMALAMFAMLVQL